MDDRSIVAALLAAAGFDVDDTETDAAAAMYPIVRAAAGAVAAAAAADAGDDAGCPGPIDE